MSNEGFLSRWSRKKVDTKDDVAPVIIAEQLREKEASLAVVEDVQPEGLSQEEQEELIASLPDVETLEKDSDFTAFLKEGVPEQLQKLWRTDPVFANLDGLNDYDEDFSVFTPLAKGVAEELRKMMKENSQPTPEVVEEEEVLEEESVEDVVADELVEEDDGSDDGDVGDGEDDL